MQDSLVDQLDLRLIHALQVRARIPWTTLAGRSGCAATLMRRWRRLVDNGYVYVTAMTPLEQNRLSLALVEVDCAPSAVPAMVQRLETDPGVVALDLTASGRSLIVTLVGRSIDAISAWTMALGGDPRITALRTHHVSQLVAEASVWRPRALSQTEESALRAWPPRGEADAKLTREERAAVIELLSQDVRRPITELAERSGLSKRRVSDFLSAMTTSGDLLIRVDLARRLTPFPIFAYYFLTVHPSRVGQIAAQLGRMSETRMVARIVGRYNLAVTFWLRSLGDLQRLEEALDARLRDVVIEDRTLVTRTPKHVGHLLDDDSFATRGRVRVLPV